MMRARCDCRYSADTDQCQQGPIGSLGRMHHGDEVKPFHRFRSWGSPVCQASSVRSPGTREPARVGLVPLGSTPRRRAGLSSVGSRSSRSRPASASAGITVRSWMPYACLGDRMWDGLTQAEPDGRPRFRHEAFTGPGDLVSTYMPPVGSCRLRCRRSPDAVRGGTAAQTLPGPA